MKAFVFGAGASFGYSGSKTGLGMPLARNFFDTFHKFDISEDRNVLHGFIVHEAARRVGIPTNDIKLQFKWANKYRLRWNVDIEDFASEIEERLPLASAGKIEDQIEITHYTKAYDELMFLFAAVMNETQNGDANKSYFDLVSKIGNDGKMITFNWDTMLDRALSQSGDWHIDNGYGIDFKAVYKDG